MGLYARPPFSLSVTRQSPGAWRPKTFASGVPCPWFTYTVSVPEAPVRVSPAAHRPRTLPAPRCPSACPSSPPFCPSRPPATHRPPRPPASFFGFFARLLASILIHVCYSFAHGVGPQEATAWAAQSGIRSPFGTPEAKSVEFSAPLMPPCDALPLTDAPGTALGVCGGPTCFR